MQEHRAELTLLTLLLFPKASFCAFGSHSTVTYRVFPVVSVFPIASFNLCDWNSNPPLLQSFSMPCWRFQFWCVIFKCWTLVCSRLRQLCYSLRRFRCSQLWSTTKLFWRPRSIGAEPNILPWPTTGVYLHRYSIELAIALTLDPVFTHILFLYSNVSILPLFDLAYPCVITLSTKFICHNPLPSSKHTLRSN